jgi:hypothetical protein
MTGLIIKNARLATHKTLVNILITDQHIARIEEIADDNANSQDSQQPRVTMLKVTLSVAAFMTVIFIWIKPVF